MKLATPAQHRRKFFVIPQGCEGGGYYTYGRPGDGRYQYAHPKTITLLLQIASQWAAIDTRKFGVGDISLANGIKSDMHDSHMNGLQIDVRPVRIDGARLPCRWFDAAYDQEATAKLIGLFRASGLVKSILFNDTKISGVIVARKHDDHFHVNVR